MQFIFPARKFLFSHRSRRGAAGANIEAVSCQHIAIITDFLVMASISLNNPILVNKFSEKVQCRACLIICSNGVRLSRHVSVAGCRILLSEVLIKCASVQVNISNLKLFSLIIRALVVF